MRFTLSTTLAVMAFLAASIQAAPAQVELPAMAPSPAAPAALAKKALGKQRIAAAQYNPRKRAELEERTFINLPDLDFHPHHPSKPQPSQSVCKVLPFMPCTDCCPPGFTCRNLLDWDKRDLAKVDKRTFFEKRCYLNIHKGSSPSKGQHWRREGSEEEEVEQVDH